jgi:hypothetical protein
MGMAPSLRQRGWSVFVLSFARKGPECDGYKMNRKNSTLAALAAGARRFLMVILAKELFYSNFVAGNAPFLAHMRQIGRTGGLAWGDWAGSACCKAQGQSAIAASNEEKQILIIRT